MSDRPTKPVPRGLAWLGLLAVGALMATSVATAPRRTRTAAANGATGDGDGGAPDVDEQGDRGPGEEHPAGADAAGGIRGYAIGLGLAGLLTVVSFSLPGNALIWGPAVPAALIVFAIAQMGVHLVFFLHLTTGPDNTNNAMALAFGCIVVLLVIGGSLWIMWHLDHNMVPMSQVMDMQR